MGGDGAISCFIFRGVSCIYSRRLFSESFGCSKEKSSSKSLILISCLNATGPFRHVQLYLQAHETHFLLSWGFQLSLVFSALIQWTLINLFSLWLLQEWLPTRPCIINQFACGCENHILKVIWACSCILSLAQHADFWSQTLWPTLMGRGTPWVQTANFIPVIRCLLAHDEQALLSSVELLS